MEEKNVKSIVVSLILLICFIITIVISLFYTQNMNFRNWIDKNIFRKIITEEKATEIILESDNNSNVYAYSKYITVLTGNELVTYNHNGQKEYTLNVNISTPIYSAAGEYLVIADSGKNQAYMISGKNIIWETEIEGNISDVYVNKNGYTVLTIANTSYKTVVAVYNPSGKELFKQHLATTNVVDVAISDDDSYLAIAQIDTSGILIQSKIKVVSIDKAQKNDASATEYIHNSKQGNMIISINYNNRNYLTCMYDNSIYIIKNNEEELLLELNSKTDVFASIDLKNYVFRIEEDILEKNGSRVHIKNIFNKKEKNYTIDSAIKEITCYADIIAVNVGTEVYFLNMSGYLIKKYTSEKEIQNIVLTDSMAAIVYRDTVKIVNL